MGQEASCCGNTQKTTRSGGKVTYGDGAKKKHIRDKRPKRNYEETDRDTCKLYLIESKIYWRVFLDDLGTDSSSKSSVSKEEFQLMKVIGRGSYGKVYLVTHLPTDKVYAMKSIKKELIIKTD